MRFFGKIQNRVKGLNADWNSDIHFSKKYARLRRKDNIFSSLGLRNMSDKVYNQREAYIISYLKDNITDVIRRYADARVQGEFEESAPIWVCWWTGLETAPPIVGQCVRSVYQNAGKHKVVFVSSRSYREYIEVPDYFIRKLEAKTMKVAHFCDYLRIALLERYGGLWVDATIFCSELIPDTYFTLPFFTLKSSYTESRYISKYQWVTFCLGGWKHNQFYAFIKEALEAYWQKNDYAIDYLLFDYIIYIAKCNNPYIKQLMDDVPENTPHRDDLQAAFNARLPAEHFNNIIQNDTGLYKLSWRESYSELTEDGKMSVFGYFLSNQI